MHDTEANSSLKMGVHKHCLIMPAPGLSLTSIAMLRVHVDRGRDYVDYLVPFVTHALKDINGALVTDANTQERIRSRFGLNIPIHACNLVLSRLAKKGYLKREHGTFTAIKAFPETDIESRRAEAQRAQIAIVAGLILHAKEQHQLDWQKQDAEVALVGYLGRFSLDFMKAFTKGTTLPALGESDTSHFVVSSFVTSSLSKNPDLFERMASLVKGHMLANALLCNDLESLQKKFNGVTFYLDTPFVMRLLKFWGAASYKAALELVELLRRLNGEVAIFEHTVVEIFHVLTFAENNVENPALSGHRMISSLRREGIGPADLVMAKGTFERFIGDHKIQIKPTPFYEHDYQIDEAVLEKAIRDEIEYSKEKALLHDINSIRSIFALRRNRHPLRIEDSAAVFITTNSDLAQAAYTFGKEHASASEVSSVITDFSLANIAWLKAPMEAPDLPLLELMSECYGAMEPTEKLWGAFIDEADKLMKAGRITAEEHDILRHSQISRDQLMNMTLGSEEGLSAGRIQEILERTKESLTKEKDRVIQSERKAKEEALERESSLRESRALVQKRLAKIAIRIGSVARWMTFVFVFLVIVAALVFASGLLNPRSGEVVWWPYLRILLLFIGLFWAVGDAVWGWSINGFARATATRIEAWALGRLLHLADIDPQKL